MHPLIVWNLDCGRVALAAVQLPGCRAVERRGVLHGVGLTALKRAKVNYLVIILALAPEQDADERCEARGGDINVDHTVLELDALQEGEPGGEEETLPAQILLLPRFRVIHLPLRRIEIHAYRWRSTCHLTREPFVVRRRGRKAQRAARKHDQKRCHRS